MVQQEPVLYAKSISENISYGLLDCSQQRIEETAMQANAHKFITELKDKYDTQTGEKGAQLSGKLWKRISKSRCDTAHQKL